MTVSKLRESGMPADYINKFSRMLQDMDINHDLNIDFKTYTNSKSKSAVSDVVNLKILNSGAWSVRGVENMCLTLPRELEDFIVEAEEFYKTKHNGRKLRWCHQWSHGVLVFLNNRGKFEIELTTFQMAVLMCWQDFDRKKISYESLRLLTDLAISSPRSSLSGGDFTDSTEFWPNDEFTLIKNNKSQSRGRLNLVGRLQMISSGDQQKMVEQEHEDIVQLRKFRIQEGIVKIMKARRRLSNNDLQLELIPMLKHMFIPDRKLIKEQIEWLIENKYLARDEKDINLFIYLS
uniref:Cullin family profile domain-containing protein n=1 Tax=Romanomermis culicivorax TaxID=13658 RepID=A0A915KR75_ROMCU